MPVIMRVLRALFEIGGLFNDTLNALLGAAALALGYSLDSFFLRVTSGLRVSSATGHIEIPIATHLKNAIALGEPFWSYGDSAQNSTD